MYLQLLSGIILRESIEKQQLKQKQLAKAKLIE